jgi:hypothetical protein
MHDIFVVKKNNTDLQLVKQFPHAKTVEYNSDRIKLLKHVAEQSVTEHAWVIDSKCNYSEFDFTYRPSWHQNKQLHVWPTENQTLGGDTVLINAKEFLKQADSIDQLQNYQDVCWKEHLVAQSVKPEIFMWSRNNAAEVPGVKVLRYIGSHLEMMRKTITKASTPYIWVISDELDYTDFDFNWRPSWAQEKYMHVWHTENQQLGGDTFYVNVEEFYKQQDIESLDHYQTIQWHTQSITQKVKPEIFIWDKGDSAHIQKIYPDATVLRYIGSKFDMMQKTVSKSTTGSAWILSGNCNYDNFDTQWRPSWATEKQLHVWSTGSQSFGGDTFYVNTAEFQKQCIEIENLNEYSVINWHNESIPEQQKPQTVIWNTGKNTDNLEKLKDRFPDASVMRHIGSHLEMMCKTANKISGSYFWVIGDNLDYTEFDFDLRPSWATESHLHVWPTENQTKGGDTFYVNSAEFKKQSLDLEKLEYYDAITWHKETIKQIKQPDVIIWDSANDSKRLLEKFPNATVIRSIGSGLDMMNRALRKATTENIWVIDSKCDYDNFDFSWRPSWAQEKYMHVWPTENQTRGGNTYFLNVAETQSQLLNLERLLDYEVITWHEQSILEYTKPSVYIWDSGKNNDNTQVLKQRFPEATVIRNIGTKLDMMNRTLSKCTGENAFILSSNCDYTDFDFNWRPGWEKENYLHVWPTENQTKGGDTFYVNVSEFTRQALSLERLEDYEVIDWKTDSISELIKPEVFVWDTTGNVEDFANATVIRNIGNELDMMNRTLRKATTEYIWVVNNQCDYSQFDFNWRPSWSNETQLHVWPTENQTKGGDTMYVNVAELKSQLLVLESLEHYDVINWHKDSIKQLIKPQVVGWSRTGQDVAGADITLRYIGTDLEMMNRTLRKIKTPYFWVISDNCDYTGFDFDWRPSWSNQQQLHVWPTENQTLGGDTMYVNTAEMNGQIFNLEQLEHYDLINWHKDCIKEKINPQVVAWSRNSNNVDGADITLRCIGTDLEMMNRTLRKVETPYFWIVSDNCDYTGFDFDWRPGWATEKYLHVWPTENQTLGGDTMYVNTAEMKSQAVGLEHLEHYDVIDWHKDCIKEKINPQVVVWSRTGQEVDGADITLRCIGSHLEMMNRTLSKVSTPYFWIVSDTCDYSSFDFTWRPGWATEKYLHVWPTENQVKGGDTMYVNTAEMKSQAVGLEHLEHYDVINWQQDCVKQRVKPEVFVWDNTGNTDRFPDATVIRNIGTKLDMMIRTMRKATTEYIWVINNDNDYSQFDFEWRPSWAQEKYMHVWPTENQDKGGDTYFLNVAEAQSQVLNIDRLLDYNVIRWHDKPVPNAILPDIVIWDSGKNVDNLAKLKTQYPGAIVLRNIGSHLEMMRKSTSKVSSSKFWVISSNCDYTDFDFNWRPSWATETHLHVWPTETQNKGGDTFYVDTVEFQKQSLELEKLEYYDAVSWHQAGIKQVQQPDVVIWDNGKNQGNLEYIKTQYPDAIVLRNVGSRFEMMQRTVRHVSTGNAWVINSRCSYTDFDFSWRPSWATEKHIHVWPTENQVKGGDTFYIDVAEFQKQCLEIEQLEHYDAVTWHKENIPLSAEVDIIVWTFGSNHKNLQSIKEQYPNAKSLRYIGTHLEMIKKSVKYTDSENFWVLSDCCDYKNFDANWRPDWETEKSIHCWASGSQAFGDTFYVPKAEFLNEEDSLEKLEYYSSIIWHDEGYSRLPWPVNYIETGDIYSSVVAHQFDSIYEYFVAPGSTLGSTVDPSLWEKRHLIAYNKNGHVSLCPRDVIGNISGRLSSYPYIQYHNCENSEQKLQDIVFISYDEKDADLNYDLLLKRFPDAKRIHGVKGNVNAYKAAAKLCDTPWYYAVFPKTKIDPEFNFDHHPDYLETPGHYIFNAHNVITDYAYGHGGVKMYHVKTTIEIENWGYDFTLSSPVTVVPMNSCYLVPASPYEAWRTSFREVLKLKDNTTVEGKYRLNRWITGNHAEFGEYSIQGAEDALSFEGDVTIANSWEWLREQFNSRYK